MTLVTSVRVSTIVIGVGLLLQPLLAQQGGQAAPPSSPPPSGNTGGGTTGGNIPGGNTTTPGIGRPSTQLPGQNPTQQNRMDFPEMNRPIFLSGKVRLDDGTPPPETVVIERVCGGQARPEAYTDSKGHFSFELGRNQGMFADASVSGTGGMGGMDGMNSGGFGSSSSGMSGMGNNRGFSERDLLNCEIRAVLPGFRSEVVSLATRRSMDNPDVGTIILHRMGNVEGRVISGTSLNAPKDAKKAFDKGQDLVKKKKIDEAAKSFQKAVEVYPKYATAWYELGRLQEAQQQVDAAKKSYEQAVAADPKYINPHLSLAALAARSKDWQATADTTARVIKLDPFDYPAAYFYNSVANYNLKNYEAAEKSALEAQKLDTKHNIPKVNQLLGILLAEKRDFNGAAEQMRNYLKFAPGAQDAAMVRGQLAEIEKLSGGAGAPPQQ